MSIDTKEPKKVWLFDKASQTYYVLPLGQAIALYSERHFEIFILGTAIMETKEELDILRKDAFRVDSSEPLFSTWFDIEKNLHNIISKICANFKRMVQNGMIVRAKEIAETEIIYMKDIQEFNMLLGEMEELKRKTIAYVTSVRA